MNHQTTSQEASPNGHRKAERAAAPIETFTYTFPATAISPAYQALAVRHGLNVYPVALFEGRQCYAFGSFRCWGGKGRNYHNRMQIKFLDDGEMRTVPGAEWAKKAKASALSDDRSAADANSTVR
jgi:hypothetical protein